MNKKVTPLHLDKELCEEIFRDLDHAIDMYEKNKHAVKKVRERSYGCLIDGTYRGKDYGWWICGYSNWYSKWNGTFTPAVEFAEDTNAPDAFMDKLYEYAIGDFDEDLGYE